MQEDNDNHQLPQVDSLQESVIPPLQDDQANGSSSGATPQSQPKETPVATSVAASVAISDMPLTAEDVDLIEKAWVEKAKVIVKSTIGDPRKQNLELSKVKADYLMKRYNKEIKVNGQED
jgi:hypothetical protein